MNALDDKRRAFRRLHETGCFVMPNPWDVGSAKYLASLDFKALATTSAGLAFAMGLKDGAVPLEAVFSHVAELSAATDLPLNVDFEAGFADTPEGVGANVARCVEAGASGLSIEDFSGGPARGLYDRSEALERLRAAREAIDGSGGGALLTGRSEGFIRGAPDLDATIERLCAYAEAGADCLYAPGIKTPEQISEIVEAVAPKPVNVLMGAPSALDVSALQRLGVRRISIGASLARSAWGGFIRAAKGIAESGTFDAFADATPMSDIIRTFG